MKIFSVYDSKGDVFSRPIFDLNAGVALRGFADTAKAVNGENPISQHPEDYTLFELGEWDESSGNFKMHDAKHSLGIAIEFVEKEWQTAKQPTVKEMRTALSGNGDSRIQGAE